MQRAIEFALSIGGIGPKGGAYGTETKEWLQILASRFCVYFARTMHMNNVCESRPENLCRSTRDLILIPLPPIQLH